MKKLAGDKPLSTFDRIMQDKKRKTLFDQKYELSLLSEFLLEEAEKEPSQKDKSI